MSRMNDDEIGKNFFQYTNQGWVKHNPIKWEDLGKSTQSMWIARAKAAMKACKRED